MSDVLHELVLAVKRMAVELERSPTRAEFCSQVKGANYKLDKVGSFASLLQAAGLETYDERRSKGNGKKKFVYIPAKPAPNVFSNYINVDIPELFSRFGNPEFLRMIAWPDVHVEHVDQYAVNCALEITNIAKPDIFLQVGDFLNAGGLSHWPSDSLSEKRIVPECERGRELFGMIRGVIGDKSDFWFIEGNHEDWIRQFIVSGVNPQLFEGLERLGMDITLAKLLGFEKFGIRHFELNKIVKVGNAAFTHGLYTGDNHPKQHLVKVKHTLYYGHTHDGKGYDDTSIFGPVRAQALKCLCDLNPTFLRGRLNNWSHGVAEFIFFPEGTHIFTPIDIVNGRANYMGRLIKG